MLTDSETPVARFPAPESVGPREWGVEDLLVLAPNKYSLKRICMNEGARGGVQKHRLKDEAGYMLKGELKIIYDDGSGTLVDRVVGPGECFHFPNGSVHGAVALSDVEYVEVSTPHFNDRVHMEAVYGLAEEYGGLPSTEVSEIETR
jgi:quercetin dioxygenase-like cupin family protein